MEASDFLSHFVHLEEPGYVENAGLSFTGPNFLFWSEFSFNFTTDMRPRLAFVPRQQYAGWTGAGTEHVTRGTDARSEVWV